MTEIFQIAGFPKKNFKLPEQCKKLKLANFLLTTYVEKTSYFEDAPLCHTMLTNIDNLKKKNKYVS